MTDIWQYMVMILVWPWQWESKIHAHDYKALYELVSVMPKFKNNHEGICQGCAKGNHRGLFFIPQVSQRHLIHSELSNMLPVKSLGGCSYRCLLSQEELALRGRPQPCMLLNKWRCWKKEEKTLMAQRLPLRCQETYGPKGGHSEKARSQIDPKGI